MTQVFTEAGDAIPCTVLVVGPCVVVQRRDINRDGYEAVQIGLVEPTKVRASARGDKRGAGGKNPSRRSKGIGRALKGHLDKAGVAPMKHLKEFRIKSGEEAPAVGEKLLVTLFKPQDRIDVSGRSKGKGFQGVMKRHNFAGGAASHGSMFHRAPGSVGQSAYPSRTFKGMRMPGRMGGDNITVMNLEVVRVEEEHNLMVVRGAVPGARGAYLTIRRHYGVPKVVAAPARDDKSKKKKKG